MVSTQECHLQDIHSFPTNQYIHPSLILVRNYKSNQIRCVHSRSYANFEVEEIPPSFCIPHSSRTINILCINSFLFLVHLRKGKLSSKKSKLIMKKVYFRVVQSDTSNGGFSERSKRIQTEIFGASKLNNPRVTNNFIQRKTFVGIVLQQLQRQ